jgi:hypothetical protein
VAVALQAAPAAALVVVAPAAVQAAVACHSRSHEPSFNTRPFGKIGLSEWLGCVAQCHGLAT